ncbi:non-specific serine/threonine protein kinase [Malassezia brasiliensis]|uniref:non-specific serine/threonine protein kinase n=1 Tax=Malassezia brasiliensis TaxID=1821822 RepID=A0AAF0DXB9_9BASI|nr:non-specific serine/threonine protein kinase [Malassezia brasiliensis]
MAANETPPMCVGEYVVDYEIGKGSFAQVYRAHHRGPFRELVAVKSVTRAKLSPKLLENLEGEISILKSMRHTNIVDLRDCIYTDDYIHMVMEYCPGGDLSQYIRNRGDIAPWNGDERSNPLAAAQRAKFPHPEDGGLNDAMVRSFLAQLASALRFLRSRDIVHRDIKPQNLLLRVPDDECLESGHPREIPQIKVADFGFARSLPAASLAKTLCGSPLYMAPEILRYEKYDAKADLWSVGAVLYEMSVGKPPFRATNHVELLRRIEHSNDRIKFPDERSSDSLARDATRRRMNGEAPRAPPHPIAADIKALIRKLLKRHPVERISFDEFFHDDIITSVPYVGRAIIKDDLAASMLSDHTHRSTSPDPPSVPTSPTALRTHHDDDTEMDEDAPLPHATRPAPAPPAHAAPARAAAPDATPAAAPPADAQEMLASRLMDLPLHDKTRTPNTAFGFEPGAPPGGDLSAPRPLPKRSEPERTLQPSALSRAMSLTAGAALAGSPRTDDASGTAGVGAAFRGAHRKAHTPDAQAAGAPQPPPRGALQDETAPDEDGERLRGLAQKAYVLGEFADAKLAEYQSGARPPSGGLSPAGSSPNSAALHAQETTIAEALALYVRALGFLQRGLTAMNAYAESLHDAEPTSEMRDYAHWFRTHFQRCYERSMYARGLCSPSTLPDNVQQADRQIFDKALELARAAALDELEGNRDGLSWDPTSCVLAYETAASLLQGLLDPGEENLGLSMNSVLLVEKFLKSIHKRLGALQAATQPAPEPA